MKEETCYMCGLVAKPGYSFAVRDQGGRAVHTSCEINRLHGEVQRLTSLNLCLGQGTISVNSEMERLGSHLETAWSREARLEKDLAREKCPLCRLRHWWLSP